LWREDRAHGRQPVGPGAQQVRRDLSERELARDENRIDQDTSRRGELNLAGDVLPLAEGIADFAAKAMQVPLMVDFVEKSQFAGDEFSRKYEAGSNCRFV